VSIRILNITKRFGNIEAVKDVNLEIRTGEFFTLLGPSGCGKTTLLRSIAGFNRPEKGEIYFENRRVDTVAAHKRGVGMVFQNYAVFPHLSVYSNVAYGLRARKVPSGDIKIKVQKALDMVRLRGFEDRYPNQLSGGQLQRVAIARALVIQPQVLLMDEPLSNLDAKLRVEMRSEIRDLQRGMKITTLYVTHDQEEALSVSDRIAVMNLGVIEQVGKPWEIYTTPSNRFVAGFIGSTNFFEGTIAYREGDLAHVQLGGIEMKVPVASVQKEKISFAIRPEAFKLVDQVSLAEKQNFVALIGKVRKIEYLGNFIKYELELANGMNLKITSYDVPPHLLKREGETLEVVYEPQRVLIYND